MAFQFPANPLIDDVFTPISGTTYQWNGTGWVLFVEAPMSTFASGIVMPYAGSVDPLAILGWLPCDGASLLVADYPALFTAIGYNYGGAGLNFNVPDLRGRVPAGFDDMSTAEGAAGRITASWADSWNGSGGAETVALTAAELAAHTHSVVDPGHVHTDSGHTHIDAGHSHTINDPGHTHDQWGSTSTGSIALGDTVGNMFFVPTVAAQTGITVGTAAANLYSAAAVITSGVTGLTVASSGSGTAHANIQPTLVLNYIIKT